MSAKGLEWALKLRGELQARIEELREALAGIEPLRRELARLEEQLRGLDRLVAVYHDQLGYRKPQDAAQAIAARTPFASAEEASTPVLEEALLPMEIQPPTLVAIIRSEVIRVAATCRKGIAAAGGAVERSWLSLRLWLAKRLAQRDART